MKNIKQFLCAGLMAAVSCSIAQAQIRYTNTLAGATLIYSNGFDGAAVTITNTPPDYATNLFGGTNNAVWIDAGGTGDTGAFFANGTVSCTQGDSILLPFHPQTNQVYTLTASVNFFGYPGNWVAAGFAQNYATPGIANAAFNGSGVDGFNWTLLQENSANTEYFAGATTGNNIFNKNGAFGPPNTGIHTLTFILDTTSSENSSNRWTIAGYIDGVQMGANFTYANNPTLGAIGVGQHSLGAPANYQWTSLALYAAQLVILQQPVSGSVNAGAAFTNTVVAGGAPPFSYQWYNSGVPLTNGGAISGATNATLVINPAGVTNAGTNYYVIVTNSAYGAMTSSPWSLTVFAGPSFPIQIPATNSFTVYAGANPEFSVTATGKQPITYQWFTNGAAYLGQTNSSFTWRNVQIGAITAYCIASNSVGAATSMVWNASVIADPATPFPANLLGLKPIGYWPLNEAEVGSGDDGVVAIDYAGGNNGTYTNVILGYPGYSSTDPNDTSPVFGSASTTDCGAFGIQGINFGAPTNTSTTFTVQAWVNGAGGAVNGAGIVSEGYQGSEQFDLDIANRDYQFLVRDASGNSYSATAGFGPDGNWHHLAGVCDEVNGAVSLYVDGELAASAPISSGSGLLSSTNAMSIGANSSTSAATYDLQFQGYIDQVAAFNYALTYAQVVSLYESFDNTVPAYLVPPPPPTNVVFQGNKTLTIPATVSGDPPVGYYWTNLTTGAVMGSGATTNLADLNATLSIPDASTNLSGDQLELVVTNAFSSTSWLVSLFSPPAPMTLSYTNDILYSNDFDAGPITISGTVPTVVNSLVGGTNTVWICTYTNNTSSLNGTVLGNGFLGTNSGSALLPFTPVPGYVYTMTASLTAPSSMQDWVAMGFAQTATPINIAGAARFTDTPFNGYAWMYVQNSSGNFEEGPRTAGSVSSITSVPLPSATPVTLQIILDTTTNNAWTASAFVNGTQIGGDVVYTNPPPIAYAGLCQNQFSSSPPTGIQWNYWELTEEGTNVPPYLLAPLPPTNVTVPAGSTLTIPATAFGAAPLGYYWSNTTTAAVLGSGATANLSPLNAAVAVPNIPISWNGEQLALTVTNAYGTNITMVALSVLPNLTPTNIVVMETNGQVTLSWPFDHVGWTLQVQTNTLIATNWANVAGSTSTNQVIVPVIPTNGAVFYRMIYP